jgi:DNA-binding NtrC family response regulator
MLPSSATKHSDEPPSTARAVPLRVLIVDDEALFARAVARRLNQLGYDCQVAERLAQAREALAAFSPELILLDLRLPDGSGLDFLNELPPAASERATVIVITAFGELADAVEAMKRGAADYLKKPIDLDELVIAIDKASQTAQLKHRLDYSRSRDHHSLEVSGAVQLIGKSVPMLRVREQIQRLAQLTGDGGTPAPTVLILGETGTGKDLAARLLHLWSPARERPFVQVDCASLPRDLVEAELFGHEKGAFTSAHGARVGLIEAAEDGAVFLDEIGELPPELQAKLLHVIERRQLRRIGATRERPTSARFIAGTNRDLAKAIQEGSFRADLYYRLNVVSIVLPPLRERGEDVMLLAQHYAAATARRYGLPVPQFSAEALCVIRDYHWPGNVRELKHLIERAVLLCDRRSIRPDDLALVPSIASASAAAQMPDWHGLTLDAAERMMIEHALKEARGNVSEAARRLGVSRMAMRYRMEKHGLAAPSGSAT